MLLGATLILAASTAGALHQEEAACLFCGTDPQGRATTFDFSGLPNKTFTLEEASGYGKGSYLVAPPCDCAATAWTARGLKCTPMTQGTSRGLADIVANVTVAVGADGVNVTIAGGSNDPPMPNGRNAVYHFVCDAAAPVDNGPDASVTESPPGFYNVVWRHPSICTPLRSPNTCPPRPPVPPLPPTPPPTPAPPVIPCGPGSSTCLPSWKPTWHLPNSTVLYTCNNSGMHDVRHANQFGVVVYDWSNAKALWANAHPMSSEELITKQAELVLADRPGLAGYMPRVWAYRNTIKALNWYSSVRKKLDDPRYSSWFIKFKGFSDSEYPGGQGKAQNGSFHVPTCDWYGNATHPPKCSGFYHDQEQTPEHPTPEGGSWPAYRVDGACVEQCDCGAVNPCAEYIFNHSGAEVEGRTFRDWFINEYMISNETLLHRDPKTGAEQVIGLGWLDDNMGMGGPSEEDKHYIEDTGASPQSMYEQVAAYKQSMYELTKKVVPMGGFWWQLMDGRGSKLAGGASAAQCLSTLRDLCVGANESATPSAWNRMQMYNVPNGGSGLSAANFTDYTAEFLLTRGPYALLGYSWCGCTNGQQMRPRAKEWDDDYGEPLGVCKETGPGTGVFRREWTGATVEWNCNARDGAQHGMITPK